MFKINLDTTFVFFTTLLYNNKLFFVIFYMFTYKNLYHKFKNNIYVGYVYINIYIKIGRGKNKLITIFIFFI